MLAHGLDSSNAFQRKDQAQRRESLDSEAIVLGILYQQMILVGWRWCSTYAVVVLLPDVSGMNILFLQL